MEGRARRLHADRADHRRPYLFDRDDRSAARGFANHHSLAREPGRGGGRSRSRRRGLERGASTQAHPHRPRQRPAIDDGRRACERHRSGHAVARPRHAIRARLRVVLGDPGRSFPERCHVEPAHRDGVGARLLPPGHDVARRVGEGPVSRSEAGVTLIELLVAMALLSLVLVIVAQLNFALARRFYAVAGGAARDGRGDAAQHLVPTRHGRAAADQAGQQPFQQAVSTRRGFTLIELLVTILVIGIVGGAITRLLLSQTRFYDQETQLRRARFVSRTAINAALSDLRMVEATGGAVSATATRITVRAPYAIGVACASSGTETTLSLWPVDSTMYATAGFSGYA